MGKYDNLFYEEPIELVTEERFPNISEIGITAPRISFKDNPGTNLMLAMSYISRPFLFIKEAHKHEHEQYLCFLGGDFSNVGDFQGEVEILLGEEGEKYIVNKTTILYLPPWTVHCPLRFTRVDKPIIFMDIYPSLNYEQKK